MRYIVDLIARYQSAWGFVSGTLAGEAEGLANAGIFKAGIAFNEAKWKGRNGNEAKYDAVVYAPTDWTWAEMVMKNEFFVRQSEGKQYRRVCSASSYEIQEDEEYHGNGDRRRQ